MMNHILLKYRNFVAGSSPWYKLLFVFFLVLLFFLITSSIGLATVMILYKLDLTEVSAIIEHPDASNIALIKLLQVIQTIGIFILPAFTASFFLGSRSGSFLNLDTRPSNLSIILVVFMMIAWIPVINFTAGVNARLNLPENLNSLEEQLETFRNNYNELTNLFLATRTTPGFITNIAIMAVLPAIGEELLFRGIFQRLFADWTRNVHWGIVISSFLFSFFHFEFYGFLPRFLLGALFGYLLYWTGSIWIPMLAHFINNGIIVGYYFFMQPGSGTSGLDELGSQADLSFWLSLGGGMILSVILFYYERSHRFFSRGS